MIYRSPYPDLDIPNAAFPTVALRNTVRLGGKSVFIDAITGRTVTYGELGQLVDRVAAGLYQHGVRQRDVVAFFAPNSIDYVIAFYAVTTLGAVAAPANPLWTASEFGTQLRQQSARFLLTTPELLDKATEAIAYDLPMAETFVIGEHPSLTTFDELCASDGLAPDVEIDPHRDVAALLCSSGTTGLPKSVMLTHRALVSIGATVAAPWEIEERDVVPGQLPLFHSFGVLITLAGCPMAGATSVVLPRFDLERYLGLVQDYGATRAYVPPPVVVQLAKHSLVDDFDLSSLEVIFTGGAPLGGEIQNAVQSRLGCVVKQAYGLTEVIPITMGPDDTPSEKKGTVGIISPSMEVRIVDFDSGADVSVGEHGELWARAPQVMAGYLNNPEATAATLDADGWIHTGDLGCIDQDGYVYIVDRLKELIKYKAYQVAPAELEAVLLTHPGVADAAVVRYPDEDAGEIPKAFVVARAPLDADELMAWVADRVAPYKKIRRVEFIDVIPKSASGKILRRVLVERERASAPVLV